MTTLADEFSIPQEQFDKIAEAIHSSDSPVGIDAKTTHVLILHKLLAIEARLDEFARRIAGDEEE